MTHDVPQTIYVEFLTIPRLVRDIFPALRKSPGAQMYIFDTTASALVLAKLLGQVFGFHIEKLKFKMEDVRDAEGRCVYLRTRYQDLARLQTLLLEEDQTRQAFGNYKVNGRLKTYLAKASVSSYDFYGSDKYSELWHAIVLMGIAQWHEGKMQTRRRVHLYLYDRPFWDSLARYADGSGVHVHNLGGFKLRRLAFRKIGKFFKKMELRLILSLLRHPGRLFPGKGAGPVSPKPSGPARIMVEHFGQFNVDRPDCFSDLFFLDSQGIEGKDVSVVFNSQIHPVGELQWRQMIERGMAAVARTVQSSLVDESKVPVFRCESNVPGVDHFPSPWRSLARQYHRTRDYWKQFFSAYNIKLWTTWYNDASHIAMADAIHDVGGISSVYQISYESNPSPYFMVGNDFVFSFSPSRKDLHLKCGSYFKYHVTVGYMGDSRFEHLRPLAQGIRTQLQKHGAERIVAYFDENTIDDDRWFEGHGPFRENYAFWLSRLLENKKLGIVFKPRMPRLLSKRLGSVTSLLRAAEKTGRCYIVDDEIFHWTVSPFSPAAAAMAADLAVHDMLWAGTAGLESALSGTKTLLLDRAGWPLSPLYKLGPDVVFQDWPTLWKACLDHWNTSAGNPALGDWSSMINELDPFRDGKAATRMSQFLKWMLEDLRAGRKRDVVMADAADRYAKLWGQDKVCVNG